MSKNIQMPVEFIDNVIELLNALEDENIDENTKDICDRIETLIIDKIDRIKKREAFTAYKTSPDGEAREQARKEYLHKAEISKDFISEKEMNY